MGVCVWGGGGGGGQPSDVIYISFLTPLVWQYIKQCLPCNTKIPIIDVIIPHALKNDHILLDFSLTVKAATLIFIPGCGSAIPSALEGKSGFIYNLVKS